MAEQANSKNPIVRLEGVSKVYGTADNPLPVLKDVDFAVNQGEYVAIVGPSGAGKSTMLNLLGCLDRPTSGAYYLQGEDVSQFDDHRLSIARKRSIGFVFQSFQLIPHLTVLENVELPLFYERIPKRQRHKRCHELIERVGLSRRASHVPSALSGGETQRVAIARAIANDPLVILADEPTGNLDTSTSQEIMGVLTELHESGRTIVLITHDMDIARTAPRRVTLRDGVLERDELQNGRPHEKPTEIEHPTIDVQPGATDGLLTEGTTAHVPH